MPGSFGTTNNDDGAVASTASNSRSGIFARNDAKNAAPDRSVGGNGVFGLSTVPNASGVFGANNNGGTGVFGESHDGDGIIGATQSSAKTGVFGKNDATNAAPDRSVGGNGVFGLSTVPNASGVFGANNNGGNGVAGTSDFGNGVIGFSKQGDAVRAVGGIGGNAIHGSGGTFAGLFEGGVKIQGGSLEVTKVGDIGGEISADSIFANNKHFRIDHPVDPATKYLLHASVESSEMMTLYSGIVMLDAEGQAEVPLPDWFEALNADFRYQLTCLGAFAPVYVARKISKNHFKIAGGLPGLEVSWQVAATRHDRWATEHPLRVVVEKPATEGKPGTS